MSGKQFAMIFGWVLLAVGILGFISNPIVGENGLFFADFNHNIVHLLSGLVFLYVAYKAPEKSAMTLKVFGIVYLLVTVLGFLAVDGATNMGSILGLVGVNSADNWLHILIGLGALIAGLKSDGKRGVQM